MKSDTPFSSLKRFKPGVKKKIHILFTALLWSCVGIGLFTKGVYYLRNVDQIVMYILIGLLLGCLKAFFVLDKAAKRTLFRIDQFQDGTCLGAVYSKKTWALILCMILFGVVIRNSPLPHYLIGILYVTIGSALSFSSRHGWIVWSKNR